AMRRIAFSGYAASETGPYFMDWSFRKQQCEALQNLSQMKRYLLRGFEVVLALFLIAVGAGPALLLFRVFGHEWGWIAVMLYTLLLTQLPYLLEGKGRRSFVSRSCRCGETPCRCSQAAPCPRSGHKEARHDSQRASRNQSG